MGMSQISALSVMVTVARRISLMTCSAAGFCGPDFCLIFASFDGGQGPWAAIVRRSDTRI